MQKRCDAAMTAVAAVAAAVGVSLASGRQIAIFFSQMRNISWLGVLIAAVAFGALCGLIGYLAERTGAVSLSGAALRILGVQAGRIVGLLYGIVMLPTVWMMLSEAGRLAALALPLHYAWWMGVAATLGLACTLCIRGLKGWSIAALAVCFFFYIILALDPRDVKLPGSYETTAALAGSVPAAVLLALIHASLSASMAAGAVVCARTISPIRMGVAAGAIMLALVGTANLALMRGGIKLLSLAYPDAALATRWGVAGFYGCIFVKWMCVTASLAHAVRTLTGLCKS